jgi:membrane-bound lytic murein transglycosylase D
MKKAILLMCTVCLLFVLQVNAQSKIKPDSLKTSRLSPQESKIIRNLLKLDTAFVPNNISLQLEVLKYNPNLIYKYRLDSIQSTVSLDYNPYVQTYIDIFLNKRKDEMGKMVTLGKYYFPIFEKALAANNIPEEFKYLPIIESSMNPMAVSRVGATGLWQFMYTTGKGYGLTIDNYVDERRDPIAASYAAAKYLKDAYNDFGDWLLALASYNCGRGNVARAMVKAGGSSNFWDIQPYLPAETRNYVPAFIAANYMMNYYTKYPSIQIDGDVIHTDSIYVSKYVSFNKIAEALNINTEELKSLNPVYKKNLVNGTLASPKRLIIPKIDYNEYASLFEALNGDDGNLDLKMSIASMKPDLTPKKELFHVVKRGETLISIANKFDVEVQDLKVWNKLKSFNIVPGQKLAVNHLKVLQVKPVKKVEPTYITYQVKKGDTLLDIAKRFENVTINSIKELNDLKSSILTIGMYLKINKI